MTQQELSKKDTLPIGDLLIDLGLINKQDLQQAKRISKDTGLPMGRVLIMSGWIEEPHLQIVLDAQTHMREGKLTIERVKKAVDRAFKENVTFETAAADMGIVLANKTRLGELMIAANLITEAQLQAGLETSSSSFLPIGRTLVLSGVLTEELLTTAINAQRLLREQKITRQQAVEGIRSARSRTSEPSTQGKQRHFYKLPARNSVRLGELLISAGAITESQLLAAVEVGLVNGLSLGQVLIEMGFVDPQTLDASLAIQKMLAEEKIGMEAASKILFRVFSEKIPLTEALKTTTESPAPTENRSLLQFLKLNQQLGEDDVKKLIDHILGDSQVIAKALVRANVLDEELVNKAHRCQQLWHRSAISLEHACITFNHAQSHNMTVEEALHELNWTQQPPEPITPPPPDPVKLEADWVEKKKIADTHLTVRNLQPALEVLLELLKIAENFPEQDSRLGEVLEKSAEVHSALEQNQNAMDLYKRALDIKVKRFGPKSYQLATTLNNMARLSYFLKNFDGAETHSQHYISVLTEALGPEHPNVGAATHNLATVYHIQKKYKEAEGSYNKAMVVCQKALGMNHPATVKILQDYAKMLRETHREQEAKHFDSCAVGLVSGTWKALVLDHDELLQQ
ncbi:MAG TPA: tetratricopeptide repeat protein [Oculatellaceae cyanobacterium]